MFRRAIVGVDGGPGGRDAAALARLLLANCGTMTLAHVPVRIARGESRSVAPRLHRLVDTSGADLLVVGSSRRGIWGRAALGDDTRSTLAHPPCAVAVAPRGYELEQPVIDRIGVGYDGSPESEYALTVARALAERLGAKLIAFRAVPVTAGSSLRDEHSDQAASIAGVDSEIGFGEPSIELAFFSDSVDLLVVGTQCEGPSEPKSHGSTARGLARSAGCPLLVVSGAAVESLAAPVRSAPLARPVG